VTTEFFMSGSLSNFPYKAQIHSSEEWGFSSDIPPFPALATHQGVSLLFLYVTPFMFASIDWYNYLVVDLSLSSWQHPRRNLQVCVWCSLSYLCLEMLETCYLVLVLCQSPEKPHSPPLVSAAARLALTSAPDDDFYEC